MTGRVTLEDIAVASGVSVATVSLALRNKPGISRERRDQILETARNLGYSRVVGSSRQPNDSALNVALICRTATSTDGAHVEGPTLDSFYSWVLTGIQREAEEAGMNLSLVTLLCSVENQIVRMPSDRVFSDATDGILLLGAFTDETIAEVKTRADRTRTPVTLVDRTTAVPGIDAVASTNVEALIRSTRYVLERGHRDIVFAGRLERFNPNFAERVHGYELAMEEAGLTPRVIAMDADVEAFGPILRREEPCTAVMTPNDWDAEWIVPMLQSRGIGVPEEVSIIGFDDTSHATSGLPHLTTMGVDKLSMGRLGVQLLQNRLRWPGAAQATALLHPYLVERDSVRTISGQEATDVQGSEHLAGVDD